MNVRALLVCRAPPLLALIIIGSLTASCQTDDAARDPGSQAQLPKPRLAVPAIAVRHVEAPGLNVDDLTVRVRDAVDESAGVPCVDETAVRAELASCTEAPCPDAVARQYRDATLFVDSSVSRVGDAMLATVRVQRGMEEVARATASDPDARKALTQAGEKAGAALRKKLLAEGAEPLAGVDPTVGAPDATTGRVDPASGTLDETAPRPDAATERGE